MHDFGAELPAVASACVSAFINTVHVTLHVQAVSLIAGTGEGRADPPPLLRLTVGAPRFKRVMP